MRPLKLSFYSRPSVGRLILTVGLLGVWIGTVAVAGYAYRLKSQIDAKQIELRREAAEAARRNQEMLELQTQNVLPPVFAQDAQRYVRWASAPWSNLFASIESAQVAGAKVVGLQVSAAEGIARLEVECTTNDVLQKYIAALRESALVDGWRPTEMKAMPASADSVRGDQMQAIFTYRW